MPVDDGAIREAFEHLDAQMDAWLAAMKRAERLLASGAHGPQVNLAEPDPIESTPIAPTVESAFTESAAVESILVDDGDGPMSEPTVEMPSCETGAEYPASVELAATVESAVEPVGSAPTSSHLEPQAEATTVQPTTQNTAPQAPALASPPPPEPSGAQSKAARDAEGEALLATLDDETAKAIRVMRRMCMNQKSVQELLAEYQARKDQPSASSSRKSWFRRGK